MATPTAELSATNEDRRVTKRGASAPGTAPPRHGPQRRARPPQNRVEAAVLLRAPHGCGGRGDRPAQPRRGREKRCAHRLQGVPGARHTAPSRPPPVPAASAANSASPTAARSAPIPPAALPQLRVRLSRLPFLSHTRRRPPPLLRPSPCPQDGGCRRRPGAAAAAVRFPAAGQPGLRAVLAAAGARPGAPGHRPPQHHPPPLRLQPPGPPQPLLGRSAAAAHRERPPRAGQRRAAVRRDGRDGGGRC